MYERKLQHRMEGSYTHGPNVCVSIYLIINSASDSGRLCGLMDRVPDF
jgi:hypothetical protein